MNEPMLALLEERNLAYLLPDLRILSDLTKLLFADISSNENDFSDQSNNRDMYVSSIFASYLTNQVEKDHINLSDFIETYFLVIYDYIYHVGSVVLGSSASQVALMTRERSAWNCLVPEILTNSLRSSLSCQLDALHALQLFWTNKDMPKG